MAVKTAKKAEESSTEKSEFEAHKGLKFRKRFTRLGVNPLDDVESAYRSSVITNPDGSIVFKMDHVEVPKSWSQLATDIIVSKYFRKAGVPGTGHEVSARQVFRRLARTLRKEGEAMGYFDSESARVF